MKQLREKEVRAAWGNSGEEEGAPDEGTGNVVWEDGDGAAGGGGWGEEAEERQGGGAGAGGARDSGARPLLLPHTLHGACTAPLHPTQHAAVRFIPPPAVRRLTPLAPPATSPASAP